MSKCRQCGQELPPGARFCVGCGAQQTAVPQQCGACGARIPEQARFCPHCGTPLGSDATRPRRQSATLPPAPRARSRPPAALSEDPRHSRRRYVWLGVLLVPVLCLCGAVAIAPLVASLMNDLRTSPALVGTVTPWAETTLPVILSGDQQRLVERFSYPDTFTLVLDREALTQPGEPARLELWNYHTYGTCFKFADGAFRGIDSASSDEVGVALFRPDQFHGDMSLDDVNQVVGDLPRYGAAVAPPIASEVELYIYDQGLVVGLLHGKLMYATTEPLPGAR